MYETKEESGQHNEVTLQVRASVTRSIARRFGRRLDIAWHMGRIGSSKITSCNYLIHKYLYVESEHSTEPYAKQTPHAMQHHKLL